MSDFGRQWKDVERRVEQIETIERPGGVTGFDTFYASGTWTPSIVGSITAGTFTYNAVTAANYTRIGNVVLFRGRITITAVSVAPTGNLSIQGFPFTGATVTSTDAGVVTFAYWSTFGLGGGNTTYVGGVILSGNTKIDLVTSQNNGGAVALLTGATAAIAANTEVVFAGQCQV